MRGYFFGSTDVCVANFCPAAVLQTEAPNETTSPTSKHEKKSINPQPKQTVPVDCYRDDKTKLASELVLCLTVIRAFRPLKLGHAGGAFFIRARASAKSWSKVTFLHDHLASYSVEVFGSDLAPKSRVWCIAV